MTKTEITFAARSFTDLTLMELHDVLALREAIFVVEQGIWQEPDIDGRDATAIHVLGTLRYEGELVATTRVHLDEEPAVVSRVVVRRDLRGRGVGRELMTCVHELLAGRAGAMSAQLEVVAFYEGLGWQRTGEPYEEAGIPHVRLERSPSAEARPS